MLFFDTSKHALGDPATIARYRARLDKDGALILRGLVVADVIAQIVEESCLREDEAFYAKTTHNVYLTPTDPELPLNHAYNRQVTSSKGLIADDQIPDESPLRRIYNDGLFREFLCGVLGIDEIHPYDDALSSINVHFASRGKELGWHFDNSSFAVTMLLQAPDGGGRFEFVPWVRDAAKDDMGFDRVNSVLNGCEPVQTLQFEPGDLVLFRGRDAMHRVTPTEGNTTRMLVVFAFNERPGVKLSESALATFYGRKS